MPCSNQLSYIAISGPQILSDSIPCCQAQHLQVWYRHGQAIWRNLLDFRHLRGSRHARFARCDGDASIFHDAYHDSICVGAHDRRRLVFITSHAHDAGQCESDFHVTTNIGSYR